jgi:hypothetical protein
MNAVDTNLWIYCHDTLDPNKQLVAQHLIATVRPLALPWQVGCEFIAANRKLAPQGFDEIQAWSALTRMQAMANVLLLQAGNSGLAIKAWAFLLGWFVGCCLY